MEKKKDESEMAVRQEEMAKAKGARCDDRARQEISSVSAVCSHTFRCGRCADTACLGKAPRQSRKERRDRVQNSERTSSWSTVKRTVSRSYQRPSQATTEYASAGMQQFIKATYHNKLAKHTDGQPAITSIMNRGKDMLRDRITTERTPRHGSQSNGHAEGTFRAVSDQVHFRNASTRAPIGLAAISARNELSDLTVCPRHHHQRGCVISDFVRHHVLLHNP